MCILIIQSLNVEVTNQSSDLLHAHPQTFQRTQWSEVFSEDVTFCPQDRQLGSSALGLPRWVGHRGPFMSPGFANWRGWFREVVFSGFWVVLWVGFWIFLEWFFEWFLVLLLAFYPLYPWIFFWKKVQTCLEPDWNLVMWCADEFSWRTCTLLQ